MDFAVVGGGIVGLATAGAIERRHPGATVTVIEKEQGLGRHQTGHNSGVLHSGIYYRPGSLKARLCVTGREAMVDWCQERDIDVRLSGKVVVAVADDELEALETIRQRAIANGVAGAETIGTSELRDLEPHVVGVGALWVPETGAVDFTRVVAEMGRELQRGGVEIRTGVAVVDATRDEAVELRLSDGATVVASRVVACAGLHSDRVARRLGLETDVQIIPFRGEYWHLRRPDLVRSMVYPVPDPRFPFLGLHYTKRIDGTVEVGPNAVFALAREGYSWLAVDRKDLVESLRWPGLRTLGRRYWRTGAMEISRSLIKPLLVRAARRLIPAVDQRDLVRAGAGVRAQAVGRDGALIDDFVIADDGQIAAVLNAPSPAATASLAIADEIVSRL